MQIVARTFHVTQILTAPYKHNQNQPAEIIGTTINRSLRILCAEHQEWDKILPIVAMSYRSTPTAGKNLSPFQIWFARLMFVETDLSLLSNENIKEITPAHLQEVRLRLKVLHTLAIQNAEQNAERQRQKYNAKTKIPTCKVGDKVLLYNSAVKPHQCAKLLFKCRGPFQIISEFPHFQYTVKDPSTAKILKNPVHADRMRPCNQLEEATEDQYPSADICSFEGQTQARNLDVRVVIADATTVECDALIYLFNKDSSKNNEI
jgi:hypothetical protein